MKRTMWFLVGIVAVASSARAAEPDKRVLTIEEALHTAQVNHPQLRVSRAQTEVSVARANEAKAPLLPQVTGNGSYTRSAGNVTTTTIPTASTPSVTTTGIGSSNFYRFGATASELIYDFGQTTEKWKAAKASLRSQEENERNSAVQVALALRSTFYAAAAARALLKVAKETLGNQEAHLRQIQGFVEAGTRPEIDLAQARTDRANAQVLLINAQVGYETAKALLNQAMGVEGGTDYDVAEPPVQAIDGENGSTDDLLSAALKARPDIQALARQIEAQEFTTSGLKGGYAPSLNVSTGLSEQGKALDSLNWGWNAILSLTWQIFGGGITNEQVRESRASTAALRAQYDSQHQQVRLDVEQARLGVRAAKAAIEATHEAAVNARVRLGLAEGRYQAGVGNAIELGDSQVALTSAAAQEVQAIFNLATARAKLLQALGRP
jgi:outer membrane protein